MLLDRTRSPRRRSPLPAALAALIAVVVLAVPASAGATVRQVSLASAGDNPGCATPCRHIAYAVTQTNVGDTVDVGPGTFDEAQIVIDKPMTVHGQGPGQTIVNGHSVVTGNGGLFYANAPSVGDITIEGFTLEGGIKNNWNPNPEPFLIYMGNVPAGGTVTIANNFLLENTTVDPNLSADYSVGAYVVDSTARVAMTDNRFTGMFQGAFLENHTGPATVAGNDFDGMVASDCEDPPLNCSQGAGLHFPQGVFLFNHSTTNGNLMSIENNRFRNTNGQPITLNASPGGFSNVEIIGNNIDGHGATDSTGRPPNGIHMATGPGGVIDNVRILGNDISMSPGPARGEIYASDISGGSVSGVVAHFNRIRGAADFGIQNRAAASIDATENWWGCSGGPGASGCTTAGGTGGAVNTTPHLVLSASATPSTVLLNQSSTINANVTRDSAGNTPAGNVFPSGVPLSFGTNLGTVTPGSTTTTGPVATSIFASPTAGTANVTATLDSTTVGVPVTVNGPPPPPPGTATTPGAAAETPATPGLPTIGFLSPDDNGTLGLGSQATVGLNVTAPGGLQNVTVAFNGRPVCTITGAPFTCQFQPRAGDAGREGTFTAVVTDKLGRAASVNRAVVVGGPATLGSHTGQATGGVARIRIACARFGPCRGTVGLRSRIGGRRSPLIGIGSSPFDLRAGETKTITLDVSSRAARILRSKGFLGTRATVTTGDTAITRNLVLHQKR
jgi:hypothetical protein